MTSLTFTPVRTARDLDAFCSLPEQVFGDGPVPEVTANLRALMRGSHPTLVHGTCTLWVGRNDSGEVLARYSTHTDGRIDAKFGRPTQLFGFLAYPDDRTIADQVLAHLAAEASAAHRSHLFGPAGLLPNQNGGIVTGGHEVPGFVDGPWNPAYVTADLTRHDYVPRFAAATYICDDLLAADRDPSTLFPFPTERMAEERLRVRPLHRFRFGAERERLRSLLNASFEQLGYFTEISEAELRHQMDGVVFITDPDLFLFLECDGRPVAFMLVVPDLSAALRACNGRLDLRAQLRTMRAARRSREAILIIKGTLPEAQGHGYMRLLSQQLLRNLRARGYHTLRSTWVETTNPASAAQFLTMGGRTYQEVAFFSREVGA